MSAYLNIIMPYNYKIKKTEDHRFKFSRKAVTFKTHIGLPFSQKMDFLELITYADRKKIKFKQYCESLKKNKEPKEEEKIWVVDERDRESSPQKISILHIILNSSEFTPNFHHNLKFSYQISGTIFFHIKYGYVRSFELGGYDIIQSLFIVGHLYSRKIKRTKTSLYVIIHDTDFEGEYHDAASRVQIMFVRAWRKALLYLGEEETRPLVYKQIFPFMRAFFFTSDKRSRFYEDSVELIHDFMRNAQTIWLKVNLKTIQKFEYRKLLTTKVFEKIIRNAWVIAQHIDFIPTAKELLPLSYWTKAFCSNLRIEVFYDTKILLELAQILKIWYSITEKGLCISDFGEKFTQILRKTQKKEKFLVKSLRLLDRKPIEPSVGKYFTKRERTIIKGHSQRAWRFFEAHTKRIWILQIKILQFQCSALYEKKILKLLLDSVDKWEDGKKNAIAQTEAIFKKEAKGHSIPVLGKTIEETCSDLGRVLDEYSKNIKDSPAAELQNLDRIQREIPTKGTKTRSFSMGIAVTAAVRLPGYGNFQFVSTYGYGPHVLNFSCINDRDSLEIETKGPIKPFRIQPSLNFDVKL